MDFFYPFAALCFILVGLVVFRPQVTFEYPSFMAAAFLIFILPQAYGIYTHPERFPRRLTGDLYLMCLLCLAACWGGYYSNARPKKIGWLAAPLDFQRFFQSGIFLTVVGYAFRFAFRYVAPESLEATQWTGAPTILLFFAQLGYFGFAILTLCAVRLNRKGPWIYCAISAWPLLQDILYGGRREQTALVGLIVVMSWFFVKRQVVPRPAIVGAVIAAMLFIPSTSDYRRLAGVGPLQALKQIAFLENFREQFAPDRPSEVKNAMMTINRTRRLGDYRYGVGYWNTMVFRFVPAQFVGKGFKDSLMIGGGQEDTLDLIRDSPIGVPVMVGSLITGPGDAFRQFGFFGAGFYFFVGMFFRRLWISSLEPEAYVAQALYIAAMVCGMRAVTHQTIDFLPGLTYGIVFFWLVALFSRRPTPRTRMGANLRPFNGSLTAPTEVRKP